MAEERAQQPLYKQINISPNTELKLAVPCPVPV